MDINVGHINFRVLGNIANKIMKKKDDSIFPYKMKDFGFLLFDELRELIALIIIAYFKEHGI
jgi:hypothetical protein